MCACGQRRQVFAASRRPSQLTFLVHDEQQQTRVLAGCDLGRLTLSDEIIYYARCVTAGAFLLLEIDRCSPDLALIRPSNNTSREKDSNNNSSGYVGRFTIGRR